MKKRVVGVKLSRQGGARKALGKSLARGLIFSGKIQTTKARAKFTKGFIDKLITQAKKNTLSANRRIFAEIGDKAATKKLISEIAPKFNNINSGFTRSVNLGRRLGDAAPMVMLEFAYSSTIVKKQEQKSETELAKKVESKPIEAKKPKKQRIIKPEKETKNAKKSKK